MTISNEDIYEKLLDIERRIFSLEQKMSTVKKPDIYEYEQKIKPIQYEQPKNTKFTPPLKEKERESQVKTNPVPPEIKMETKKKTLLDEKDDKDNKNTKFSLKDALGFV